MAKRGVDPLHQRVIGNIRRLADDRGMTLSQLADTASVSQSYFWEVMAGRRHPTLIWFAKIATALDADMTDLVAKTTEKSATR